MAAALLTRKRAKKFISEKSSYRGIMVGPGRYVDLSPNSNSIDQEIRLIIDGAMRTAKFTQNCLRCEELLLEALRDVWHYRLTPRHHYPGQDPKSPRKNSPLLRKQKQELIRMYLIARLWYCWMLGTGTQPVVNNRHNPQKPFVMFVKTLGAWCGLGNIVKNAERYQSYRKRNFLRSISDSALK